MKKQEFNLSLLELDLINDVVTQHLEDYPTKKPFNKIDITLVREGNNRIAILYNE